jgi:hypothetical protein
MRIAPLPVPIFRWLRGAHFYVPLKTSKETAHLIFWPTVRRLPI